MDADTRNHIQNKLKVIFNRVFNKEIDWDTINSQTGLIESLKIDSLTALQIIVQIEQQFQIAIEDDELVIELIDSLEKLTTFIAENMAEKTFSLE